MIADVLVIGGGPSGAAAACLASQAGLHVVLADEPAPGHRHAMLVSGVAAGRLAELGVELASCRRASAFELCFPAGSRHIGGQDAQLAEAGKLRARLRQAARAAGAELVPARVARLAAGGSGHAAGQTTDGRVLRARHVVMAAGAGGKLPGLHPPSSLSAGIACAGRFGGVDVGDLIVMAPVTPAADPHARPAMVTVLPDGDGTATAWLARLGVSPAAAPEVLLAEALEWLGLRDPRFACARPLGPPAVAELATGFSPRLLADSPALIIGDAAGLGNPFTGEGLGAALLSARLASEALLRHRGDPVAAREAYSQRLSAEYVGYFETAQHAARRYHLTWRMLEASATSEHVFFARAHRALLLPEGARTFSEERVRVPPADRAVTGPFLYACDEAQTGALRERWPFLARMLAGGAGLSRHRLRTGLLFLAGLLAAGTRPDIARATPAAAIELAAFGALALAGTAGGRDVAGRSVDWAGATLVLAGDFLLAQASRMIAESVPELSWAFADWLAELAELRGQHLTGQHLTRQHLTRQHLTGQHLGGQHLGGQPGKASALHASLLEFPARTGALLGGCAPEAVQALRAIGNALGEAFAHAEDVLAITGQPTRLDGTLTGMVAARTSAIPDVTSTAPAKVLARLTDPGFRAEALTESRLACGDALSRARAAIDLVPGAMARRILLAVAAAIEPDRTVA